jgi:hypothetical protein
MERLTERLCTTSRSQADRDNRFATTRQFLSQASYANISIAIPLYSSSSFRSLRSFPTTLYRDASGSKGKAKLRLRGWKVVKKEEGELGQKLG